MDCLEGWRVPRKIVLVSVPSPSLGGVGRFILLTVVTRNIKTSRLPVISMWSPPFVRRLFKLIARRDVTVCRYFVLSVCCDFR